MARITHVKKAQQRYETVVVTDAEGNPIQTPVLRKDGTQKTTKRGKPIVRTQTKDDKSKPLPNRNCGKCGNEIKVGDPYKWIAPRSGPYGGRKLYRCEACPTWDVWEYSSSTSARIAQIQHDANEAIYSSIWESEDDATSTASEIAEMIRELAQEKEEAASNIVDGFGHETYQSEEIQQMADDLNSWADDVENVTFPDFPEADEEVDCEQCGGDGSLVNDDTGEEEECQECEGTGHVANEEGVDEDELENWRTEAQEALDSAVSECPV